MVDMAEAAFQLHMTVREFLDWEGERDVRYELWQGVPVAMAPTRAAHQILSANLVHRLTLALKPGCRVRVEAAVAPDGDESDRLYVPDLAVTCETHRAGDVVCRSPVLLVEILSSSTERHDRREKLPAYRGMPTVEEIVLIDPERPYCEVLRRTPHGWLHEIVRRRDELRLAVGLRLPLADLYEGIGLDEESGATPPGATAGVPAV